MDRNVKLNVIAYSYCILSSLVIGSTTIPHLLMFIGLLPIIISGKCFLVVIYESFKRKKNLVSRVYSNFTKLILLIEFSLFFYSLFLIGEKLWGI